MVFGLFLRKKGRCEVWPKHPFSEDFHMENKQWVSAFVISAVLGLSVPLFAHHGTNISYDRSKATTIKGTVTEFRFANPHPQLYVDVKSDDGKVTNWGCEIAA